MGGSGHLRTGDAEAILRVLEESRRGDAGPGLPWALLDGLREVLGPGTAVEYQVLDLPGRRFRTVQASEPDGAHELWVGDDEPVAEADAAYFDLAWQDPLCSYPERTGDRRTVVLSSDFFPTAAAWRNRPVRQAVDPDVTSLMQITLPSASGTVRRVMVAVNGGRGLGERHRQIGALIRPHLEEARLDAERRRAGVPRLTPREWEVLSLTAAGLTHAQIAARLYVSVSTVHKHMENVRQRLGVTSAAAAAAVAMPHAPQRWAGPRVARPDGRVHAAPTRTR